MKQAVIHLDYKVNLFNLMIFINNIIYLKGGYYDGEGKMKYGFPMAASITLLAAGGLSFQVIKKQELLDS